MAGRGDNNKHGSAGRGASNQSNQRFTDQGTGPAANNDKRSANVSTFNLNVDEVPYVVEAEPYRFNDEERYNIRVRYAASVRWTTHQRSLIHWMKLSAENLSREEFNEILL
jgi:hypothetical protein